MMNDGHIGNLRPFTSIVIIISSLFLIVFFQMEERRLGYQVLRLTKDYKRALSDYREKEIILVKLTRPQLLESLAQRKFTLKKVQSSQIIHLTGFSIKSLEPQKSMDHQQKDL